MPGIDSDNDLPPEFAEDLLSAAKAAPDSRSVKVRLNDAINGITPMSRDDLELACQELSVESSKLSLEDCYIDEKITALEIDKRRIDYDRTVIETHYAKVDMLRGLLDLDDLK